MTAAVQGRTLWHGTTRRRAEAIIRNGPDANFLEPGGFEKAVWFSTAPPHGPYPYGDPKEYGVRKAALFPEEGGPAVLEIIVPEEIVVLAINEVGESRFELGFGLEELCAAWPELPKRLL